jgi:threonine dehydratase
MPIAVQTDDVRAAAETIRGTVRRTPVLDAPWLGDGVRLKAELLQHTGSFKARGVTNRLAGLSDEERSRGVAGVSAGNHAMALAWGAQRAGIACVMVMFAGASSFKLERTRAYGAEVEIVEGGPPEAFARLREVSEERGLVVVHPFDDPEVIAGQGTVGLEILEDAPDADVVLVPTGGGGLVAGISAALAGSGIDVVAVEPEGSNALELALAAGEPVPLAPATRIGGLDGPFAGTNALATCVANGVRAVTSSDDEIEAAMRRIYADAKLACEPAGAAGVAALLTGKVAAVRPVIVVSGGNIAADVASDILAGR